MKKPEIKYVGWCHECKCQGIKVLSIAKHCLIKMTYSFCFKKSRKIL